MPSSSFIVNSEFQPMSYQELLHPVITQTQYQRELDEKYTQLDLQADKLEQLANSAVDQASYERYKSFANRLREEAGNLARYGLRGRDNARFMELFRSYGKEIQPLLDAQQKRERLIAMQQQLSMQDPTSLYDRSAGNISLEELMANPSAAPVRQSGELLRAQAAAMATNLQNELRQATFGKTKTPGYLAFTQKYGLSSADVAAFVSNPNSFSANKVLRAIYDQVMTSSGVKENWEGDAYNRASQYVGMGLWNAIGKSAVQPLTDQWALQQAQMAHQSAENAKNRAFQARQAALNRRHQKQLAAAQAAAAQGITNGIPSNIVPTYAGQPEKVEQNRKQFNKWINKKYIAQNKNGSYRITDAGMKALFSKESYSSYGGVKGPDINFAAGAKANGYAPKYFNQDFYNFMKSSGMLYEGAKIVGMTAKGTKVMNKSVTNRAQLTKNINTWFTANELGYDMKMKPLIKSNLGSTASQFANDVALSISDKTLKDLGITRNDILKGHAAYTLASEKDITMPIMKSDGTIVNVPVPKMMNMEQWSNVTQGMKQVLDAGDIIRKIVSSGQVPHNKDKNGNLTDWRKASQQEIQDYVIGMQGGIYNELLPNIERARANMSVPVYTKPIGLNYNGQIDYNSPYNMEDFLNSYQAAIDE